MELAFVNPENGFVVRSPNPWLWTLVFGIFYFMYKGIWTHVAISFIAAVLTAGLSWFIYPFFASGVVKNYFLSKGWKEYTGVADG